MIYPFYQFNEDTDYEEVLVTSQRMYSDLLHQGDSCCKSKSTLSVLCQADIFFQDIDITGTAGDNYNLDRWQEDIQGVYVILSSFFRLSADVSPVTPVIFPDEVLEQIELGESYYSVLQTQYLDELRSGCDCMPLSFECLKRLLRALEFKVLLEEYDDVAKKLVEKMLIIIGGYTLQVPPSVNAGANQTAEIGETVIFTATGTPGSSPIVSYLWTQTSGTPATLTNANTASVSVSNYPVGAITLKVTVTDQNGLTGSDTATLTGTVVSLVGYWFESQDGQPLTNSQILASNPFNFTDGGSLNIPFDIDQFAFYGFAYPLDQPTKTNYQDVANPLNQGEIGSPTDLFGAVTTTADFKQHITNYPSTQETNLIITTE